MIYYVIEHVRAVRNNNELIIKDAYMEVRGYIVTENHKLHFYVKSTTQYTKTAQELLNTGLKQLGEDPENYEFQQL